MNAQFELFHGGTFQMRSGESMRIDDVDSELAVVSGSVWLTRMGDAQDHVLRAGQRLAIGAADGVVIEPWRRGEPAVVVWARRDASQAQVRRPADLLRRGAAPLLRGVAAAAAGVALVLRRAEAGFAALARNAASTARRAQGCIGMGDSMASSGAVK